MPAVPPSPSVRNCLQASGVRRGRRCAPSQAKTRYYRKGLCVTIARGIATRRVCHRVGSRGRVPCLPHFHTYICVPSEGYKPSVTRVEWLRHSLRCLRGGVECSNPRVVFTTLALRVVSPCGLRLPLAGGVSSAVCVCLQVAGVAWSAGLRRGCRRYASLRCGGVRGEWRVGVACPCGVRGYVRGMSGGAAPQE